MLKLTKEELNKIEQCIIQYKSGEDNLSHNLWITHCQQQENLKDAIDLAARARNACDKKNSHQRRLKNDTLKEFSNQLQKREEDIQNAKTFKELLTIVTECKIKGIGELTVYDTALRIGAQCGLSPEVIYLHAGTKKGAERLLGKKLPLKFIRKEDLPPPFQRRDLTPAEIEDILCIYKDGFDVQKNCSNPNKKLKKCN